MSDITLTCPGCGKTCTVSEFVAAETLVCPSCAHHLELPGTNNAPRLRVRKMSENYAAPEPLATLSAEAGYTGTPSSTINDVHRSRGKVKGPARFLSFLFFLLLGSALVGAQYYVQTDTSQLVLYQRVSWSLYGIIYLLVLMMAAEDSYLQAILCALLPFYVVYYAFVRMESLLLRGAFMAVMISLGAEVYFLGEHSLLMILQQLLNQLIENVSNLIQRASEPPDVQLRKRR